MSKKNDNVMENNVKKLSVKTRDGKRITVKRSLEVESFDRLKSMCKDAKLSYFEDMKVIRFSDKGSTSHVVCVRKGSAQEIDLLLEKKNLQYITDYVNQGFFGSYSKFVEYLLPCYSVKEENIQFGIVFDDFRYVFDIDLKNEDLMAICA